MILIRLLTSQACLGRMKETEEAIEETEGTREEMTTTRIRGTEKEEIDTGIRIEMIGRRRSMWTLMIHRGMYRILKVEGLLWPMMTYSDNSIT